MGEANLEAAARLGKRFPARHHSCTSFYPCKRQAKLIGKNNQGKGMAWVPLGAAPIELILGTEAGFGLMRQLGCLVSAPLDGWCQ